MIIDALRHRDDAQKIADLERAMFEAMDNDKPWWVDWANALRETCRSAVKTFRSTRELHPEANDPELLFTIIAMSEERARELLDLVTNSPADALSYISEVRVRIDWVRSAAEQD
jgi:hypothetical protein